MIPRPMLILAILLTGALLLPLATADNSPSPSPSSSPSPTSSPSPSIAPSTTPAPSTSPTALTAAEQSFADLLTGATLEGTWQSTKFEEGKQIPLGEPRTDRYTIEKAEKLTGEHWLITARVQYADKDVALPVPVRVVWAGDTPVITLDTMNLPMLGTYSARVMFHKNFYSGVWYAADHGGVMSGRVSKSLQNSNQKVEGNGK